MTHRTLLTFAWSNYTKYFTHMHTSCRHPRPLLVPTESPNIRKVKVHYGQIITNKKLIILCLTARRGCKIIVKWMKLKSYHKYKVCITSSWIVTIHQRKNYGTCHFVIKLMVDKSDFRGIPRDTDREITLISGFINLTFLPILRTLSTPVMVTVCHSLVRGSLVIHQYFSHGACEIKTNWRQESLVTGVDITLNKFCI